MLLDDLARTSQETLDMIKTALHDLEVEAATHAEANDQLRQAAEEKMKDAD